MRNRVMIQGNADHVLFRLVHGFLDGELDVFPLIESVTDPAFSIADDDTGAE